jgi:hypothetical protein
MAYDEELDERIGEIVESWGTERKKMFGGTCHLLNGNMMAGVHKDRLILRLGPEGGPAALERPHVTPFDITGRPMKGWVMVEPGGFEGDALESWLIQAHEFAGSLPPK